MSMGESSTRAWAVVNLAEMGFWPRPGETLPHAEIEAHIVEWLDLLDDKALMAVMYLCGALFCKEVG